MTEVSREDTDDETEWDEVGRAVDDEILRRQGTIRPSESGEPIRSDYAGSSSRAG